VSAHILVIEPRRIYKCHRAAARRKVERGSHYWEDDFTIRLRENAIAAKPVFRDPPKDASFLWQPRPSATYIVMQARWGRKL